MILIDLDKCFGCVKCRRAHPGLFALIERGVRAAVCRRCLNPPCAAACPAGALVKTEGGGVKRLSMRCVSCRQCSAVCPVGANPAYLLEYVQYPAYKIDFEKCRKLCRRGAIEFSDELPEGWVLIDDGVGARSYGWR